MSGLGCLTEKTTYQLSNLKESKVVYEAADLEVYVGG